MSILDTIRDHKRKEVEERKSLYPIKLLEKSIFFKSQCVSLREYVTDPKRSGIIAEFKRKSPSKGDINKYANVEEVTLGYMGAGAAALSILTDEYFFGAKKDDLQIARKFNYCPILRKDFILDEYQVIESKSMGADAILLIANLLSRDQIQLFATIAHQLGMEVLLEIHSEEELDGIDPTNIQSIGINNRDLRTFEVDIENSLQLANKLPPSITKIAESGIESAETIRRLRESGFDGFLIGEYFMRHSHPAQKCKELIKQISI
ncbi:MAG: indole-3-glycerol phosphate synthase TrpC [Saprospiraceae bacterium]